MNLLGKSVEEYNPDQPFCIEPNLNDIQQQNVDQRHHRNQGEREAAFVGSHTTSATSSGLPEMGVMGWTHQSANQELPSDASLSSSSSSLHSSNLLPNNSTTSTNNNLSNMGSGRSSSNRHLSPVSAATAAESSLLWSSDNHYTGQPEEPPPLPMNNNMGYRQNVLSSDVQEAGTGLSYSSSFDQQKKLEHQTSYTEQGNRR